jgi:two-component system, OmpR family, sensor histidine kinase QseC
VSLQRRLLIYLLLCAPLVWSLALLVSASRARTEVNELFDTELIRLARQVQATQLGGHGGGAMPPTGQQGQAGPNGEADLSDLAIAVWGPDGQLRLVDREGVQLPRRVDASGFVPLQLGGEAWRAYYLQSTNGEWLVAAGHREHERDEVVWDLIGSQLLPWLLVLPLLLGVMAWAVRQALAPVRALAGELGQRSASDLQPLALAEAPTELRPLVGAMNGLFLRIDDTLARERRFTADAAHELRTPLAVLRAQWDRQRLATSDSERSQAEARLGEGIARLDRLVSQMLALSRVDASAGLQHRAPVDWTPLVEQVMSDMLPLAERRRIELGCDWPPEGVAPFPLQGDAGLLAVLLRNLLDNAVRYAPEGSAVQLRFGERGLTVENPGPALSAEVLSHLGERFHRQEGQAESGSGLGVSIAQRIAGLHGLRLQHRAQADGQGVVAELSAA